jgi:hypothetical protein
MMTWILAGICVFVLLYWFLNIALG